MKETEIEKRAAAPIRQKGQYAVAFGVIGAMLYLVGFPIFVLVFFGVLSFFIWKVFSVESRHETRKIFEFYLSANEILRDDDRRWFGFEIQEAIARGETIIRSIKGAPPLVYFALGALYQKIDDHSSAVRHLTYVVESPASSESVIVHPSKELREYVRLLRKIERSPAESPLTSSSVRSLERMRKNRGVELLELSRRQIDIPIEPRMEKALNMRSIVDVPENEGGHISDAVYQDVKTIFDEEPSEHRSVSDPDTEQDEGARSAASRTPLSDRKTISEVLHDIYDSNVQ